METSGYNGPMLLKEKQKWKLLEVFVSCTKSVAFSLDQ